MAGLLFISHPLVTHTILWVGDRSDALALPLFLAALYCFFRFAVAKHGRLVPWPVLGALALLLSLLAKETALIALPLVPLLVWAGAQREAAEGLTRRKVIIAAAGVAVSLLMLYLWRWLWGLGDGLPVNFEALPQRLAYYLMLLPGIQALKGLDSPGGLLLALIPALFFYILLLWAVWRAGRREDSQRITAALAGVPGICLLWLFITLIPVSFKFNLWYFYFLLPPFVLATTWLIRRVWRWCKPLSGFALALLLGYYIVASINAGVHWRRAAEAGEGLTADLLTHSATIERSRGLVLLSVPWNFTERASFLPLAVYNYAWGLDTRLEQELGFPVDYSAAAYTVVENLNEWSYRAGRTGDVLWQRTEREPFEETPIQAYIIKTAEVNDNEVCLALPLERPVFALEGDRYILLYDPHHR